jgi:hypothetical protein
VVLFDCPLSRQVRSALFSGLCDVGRGLGRDAAAEVSIRWLDGKVENIGSVAVGEIVTSEEGKDIVRSQPYSSPKK